MSFNALKLRAAIKLLSLVVSLSALVPSTALAQKVLVIGANFAPWNQEVRNTIAATGFFTQVDTFLGSGGTPSLATLLQYDAVLVYSDAGFANNFLMGNVLADYADAGGGVVVATFAFWTSNQALGMSGRLSSGGYLPLTQGNQAQGIRLFLVKDQPGHPILAGVNSLDGGSSSYHNNPVSVAAGASLIAHWTNGQPLVATKITSGHKVAALNFYPPSTLSRSDFWVASTDGGRLMANALLWVGDFILDADSDGVPDTSDNCPTIANPNQSNIDGDALGDLCDACPADASNDADHDGVCGDVDNCPLTANPTQANNDGDTLGDACDSDDDNDGVADGADNCPLVANSSQTNTDGDGLGDACDPDDDNDGVPDGADNCPVTANVSQANNDGDTQGDACDPDDDNDGVADGTDNCPLVSNSSQTNTDGDGLGDACDPDDDNDGVLDGADNCPLTVNASQANNDGDTQGDACDPDDDNDGVADGSDNCQFTSNADQANNDADAAGDACDSDDDNDGVADTTDNCQFIANPTQTNTDGDAQGDACDPDDDNDTVADGTDNCPLTANPTQTNTDGDTQGDACDADDDNDTVLDVTDNCQFVANASQANNDGDAQGDACDPDDDNDGVADGTDNCAFTANPSQANNDADSEGDACDTDDDNDTVLDTADNCQFTSNTNQANNDGDAYGDACDADDDNDTVPDGTDNCQFTANTDQTNTDSDAFGNACDPDDDNDGVLDGGDNCPLNFNPLQTNFDGDAYGDACDPRNAPQFTGLGLSANSITENGSTALSGSFADPDAGQAHLVVINWGDSSSSSFTLSAGVFAFTVAHQYVDDNPTVTTSDSYPISVSVTDPDGDTVGNGTNITVNNLAPVISAVTGPTGPIALGGASNITTTFTDASPVDTHTCVFNWDDATANTSVAASGGSCSAPHTFTAAGVYTVGVTITDDDTGAVSSVFEYVVVYDPSAGFVTGGGWINSAAGSYVANPTLSGKASFGFVSKYLKGQSTPTGQTEFQLHFATFRFNSTAYDWLVVAGSRAQYKGVGTVNGAGNYGFLLTAKDAPTAGGVDQFRIKIWDRVTGAIVYDNVMGDPDDIDATHPQDIGGGSIVIHSK